MEFWRIFRIFLWKNALFLRFNWKQLLVIFIGCLAIFSLYVYTTNKKLTTPSSTPELKDTDNLKWLFPGNEGDYLMYAPANLPEIQTLMEQVRNEFQMSLTNLKPLNSTAEMMSYLEHRCQGNCFAVAFETYMDKLSESDDQLNFSISSNKINISPRKKYVNDEEISMTKEFDDYMRTGFLALQHIIDKSFISTKPGSSNYVIEIAAMPSTALTTDDSTRVIMFGSLYSILFNVLLLSTFLVPLVEEKQNGLKEFLVVATPLNFLNGVTFFILRFLLYLVFLVAIIIVATMCSAMGIIPFFYMIILMILFKLSAMSYTYLLSVCFNSVFYAKVGGLLMLIVPYIFRFDRGGLSSAASVFFSTKTFMDGIEIFQIFTNKHRNFTAGDLTANITDWSYSILSVYMLLILQCVLYSLLYNYLSCVFPGPGGLKKPFLFFLKPSYYKKRQRNEYTTAERGSDAIIIQDLVKRFKAPTRVIQIADRLNMVIKNKQITVLLGHNGAGKTTIMNMIMGSVPKDSGKIIVCSERDVASYRHLIGFCPQHSVFMEYMTCGQHLRFFAQLRGMCQKEAKSLTRRLLEQLNLEEKENEYGKKLSGGMKRRLSLGIALAGETRVVILDEPSSGLDIGSRRELWDILLELRKSKAVLVTTHHMEEAEVLGDTICILSNGRLQRTGSPLELKRKVGCGYILKLCTNEKRYKESETLQAIREFVPNATVLNIVPPTVHISLPYDEKPNYKTYEKMLSKLEESFEQFGIESISVTDTSLEDVFLKCSAEVDQVDSPPLKRQDSVRIPYEPLTSPTRITFWQHFKAITYKKFLFLRSEWIFTAFMILLPIVSALLAIIMMHSMSMSEAENALQLDLSIVKQGRVYIQAPTEKTELARKIESLLKKGVESKGLEVQSLERRYGYSISDELLAMQQNDLAEFLQNVVGLIDIGVDEVTGLLKFTIYFSGNIYHSSVALINLVDDAMFKAATNENSQIRTEYMPIRRFVADISPTRLEYYAVILPIGVFFYMFYYVSLPFRECETGFKSLQAVPVFRYWFSILWFDMMQHLFVCLLLYVVQVVVMPTSLYNQQELSTIVTSVFFYGISYLPILYIFSNSFRSISAISTYLLSMLVVSAIVPLITSGSLPAMTYYETTILFMRLLPDFNLNHQLRIVNENFVLSRRTAVKTHAPRLTNGLEDILDRNTMIWYALGIFVVSWIIFLYIVEDKNKRQGLSSFFNCYKCRGINPDMRNGPEEEVCLVESEKNKVEDIVREKKESEYPLLVSNLYKFYDRKAVVCDLNFAVDKKQCFGLLGVNGAGKTTTFQMITSNETITGGNVKIDGIDLVQNEAEYRYRFGYCPQYDCLNNFMTAYEMLKYMAKLRNVKTELVSNEVEFWLEKLDLEKYANVQIRHYSGGTKRKLNAAIAMIGSPSLVLLDEPTTGVDPVSRRYLWKCVQEFQKRQKTIVLTSHSMDECEQLCNRLAIMADGRFKCIGYVPELKQRYGSGFTIKLKMYDHAFDSTKNNVKQITKYVLSEFPSCKLRENHAGMLTYFVKNEDHILWSKVFRGTESFMKHCTELVEDYSVNECTLEDIFLKFDSKNRSQKEPSTSSVEDV